MGSERGGAAREPAKQGAVPDAVMLDFRHRPAASDADSSDQAEVTRAELARQLNASIYKAGQSLSVQGDEEFELTFLCACGCMAEVKRSLRDYVIRGAVAV